VSKQSAVRQKFFQHSGAALSTLLHATFVTLFIQNPQTEYAIDQINVTSKGSKVFFPVLKA